MKNILLLVSNTIQKGMRSKTLIFLSLMTIGVIVGLNTLLSFLSDQVLTQMGMGQAGGLAISGVTLMIGMWCYFLCSFLIIDTIRSDLEMGVVSTLMTLPIKRYEYVLGRILGVWFIVGCFYFFSSTIAFFLFKSTTKMDFNISLIYAFVLNLFTYLAMISLGVLISLYFKKLTALAISMVSIFFIHGSNTYFLNNPAGDVISNFELLRFIGACFHQVLPRIGVISSMAKTIIFEQEIQTSLPLQGLHYIVSLGFLLLVINLLFRRRNL